MQAIRTQHKLVAEFITAHPEQSFQQIADIFNCSKLTVFVIAREFGIKRPRGSANPAHPRRQRAEVKRQATITNSVEVSNE